MSNPNPSVEVEAGYGVRLNAIVSGTIDPDTQGYKIPQGVVWEIVGVSAYPLAIGTFIDDEGVLHVDKNEQNTTIYVQATSTIDRTQYGSIEVGIIVNDSESAGGTE